MNKKKQKNKKQWDTSITDKDIIELLDKTEKCLIYYRDRFWLRCECEYIMSLEVLIKEARQIIKKEPNNLVKREYLRERSIGIRKGLSVLKKYESKKSGYGGSRDIDKREFINKTDKYLDKELIDDIDKIKFEIQTYHDLIDAVLTCSSVEYPIDHAFKRLNSFFKKASKKDECMRDNRGMIACLEGMFEDGLEGVPNAYLGCDALKETLATIISDYYCSHKTNIDPYEFIEYCSVACDATKYVLFKNDILKKNKE